MRAPSRLNLGRLVDRLVAAIADGAAGFQSVKAMLTLEERNLRLLEIDLTRVRVEIDRVRTEPIDRERLTKALKDFDILMAVANHDERTQLLRLLIKRIDFRGNAENVTLELFAGVALPDGGSKLRAV